MSVPESKTLSDALTFFIRRVSKIIGNNGVIYMELKEILRELQNDTGDANPSVECMNQFREICQETIRLSMELNCQYHTPEEIRSIMSKLTGKTIDNIFCLFPPFYTDFGKNITIGKDVFINSGCHFQDQGGITIRNGVLIGHNVVLATINHDLDPKNNRKNHYAPITIGNHVWIGSNATILSGVTIGEWAVVAAGGWLQRMFHLILW